MLEFYQTVQQELERGPVVLATVAMVHGSVPREVGAKMLVCADGRMIGTVGGGAGEAKVQQQALEVLQTGRKQFVEIDLSGAHQRETQGVCGGMMQVWLERWAGKQALELVKQIQTTLLSGRATALITPFGKGHPYLQPAALLQVTSTELVEPLRPPPTLLIIGAGHVAVPLTQIARLAGFQIVVTDDRSEFACADRFPAASMVLPESITGALATLDSVSQLYVALVTRGYQHDLEALRTLLKRSLQDPPGRSLSYLGMIGSKNRIHKIYQVLQAEGYPASALKAIHAPIGLEIGALTPEEIAVSICAELIQVRRRGPAL